MDQSTVLKVSYSSAFSRVSLHKISFAMDTLQFSMNDLDFCPSLFDGPCKKSIFHLYLSFVIGWSYIYLPTQVKKLCIDSSYLAGSAY